jgi:SAM-dependent methyltransferase
MKQSEVFITGEGDRWHERNKQAELNSIVVDTLRCLHPKPATVLEVGCGDARYLGELYEHLGEQAVGIDASEQALKQGRRSFPSLTLKHNTAIPGLRREWAQSARYDLIIFGFCLYILDREDLFMAVAHSDAILNQGGFIAIHDFEAIEPCAVPYKHREGVFTYKMNYRGLWLANPAYSFYGWAKTREGESITIIRKTGWEKLNVA